MMASGAAWGTPTEGSECSDAWGVKLSNVLNSGLGCRSEGYRLELATHSVKRPFAHPISGRGARRRPTHSTVYPDHPNDAPSSSRLGTPCPVLPLTSQALSV